MEYIKVNFGSKKDYTYSTVLDIEKGDLVRVPFGDIEKIGRVVETNVPDENWTYEIKPILGRSDEKEFNAETQSVLAITPITIKPAIVKYQEPEISFNNDEIRGVLENGLSQVKGMIVTAQSYKQCKNVRATLRKLAEQITRFRIDNTTAVSKNIKVFENECNALEALVTENVEPLDKSIKNYEKEAKEERREQAEEIRKEVIEEIQLSDSFAFQLTVLDKYLTVSISKKKIKEDLEVRAMVLKEQQEKEAEKQQIVVDAIEAENQRNTKQMSIEDFKGLINGGASMKTILDEIRLRSSIIYEAEHPEPIQKKERKPLANNSPTTLGTNVTSSVAADAICKVTFECTGTLEELRTMKTAMEQCNVRVRTIHQEVLD